MSIKVPGGRHWAKVDIYGEFDPDAVIGFDEPMQTHFFQSGLMADNGEVPMIWLGLRHAEFPSFEDLKKQMTKKGVTIIEWALQPKGASAPKVVSSHIKALEEAIAFSNSVPLRQAMAFAVDHLKTMDDSDRAAVTAARHRECLEDISHILELPVGESGPCDDPAVYSKSIECLLEDNAQLDKDRIAHAQARFIAEAELHQYKAVGREPISAAYPDDAVIERLQMISQALFPDRNPESSEIVFAGDVGNWAWLLNQLSIAELSAQKVSPLTLLAQVRSAISPVAEYVLRDDKRALAGLADDFRPLRPLTVKSLREIAALSDILDNNMVAPPLLEGSPRQVHAVCRRSGDYDEADETFIAAYFDEGIANAHAQTAQTWWDSEIEPLRHTIPAGVAGAAQAQNFYNKAGESPFDPGGFGTNQRYYSVQTIDIDLVPPAGVMPDAKNEIEDGPDV